MKEILDKNMERAQQMLKKECRGLSSAKTIERLFSLGLLSYGGCNAYVVREMIDELVDKKGETKMDAIKIVASQIGLSGGTIRNYIYKNLKTNKRNKWKK